MKLHNYLTIIILAITLISCGDSKQEKNFNITTNATNNTIALNETLELSIANPKNIEIESITYEIGGKTVDKSVLLSDFKLGSQTITATINFDGETEIATRNIAIVNNASPKVYSYEIVNTYPHDITSYTQGLEFFNGELYESTGQKGESKLRKVNYKTGEVLKNINLADQYFGEGLTILNNKIYQLTWLSGKGFVYNLDTFKRSSTFKFGESKEGWGICNDGKMLYKSDGTEKIWLLNPENLVEENNIQVYTNKGKIGKLNELEWINGKIYANIYQRNGVAIINPKNGATEAVIDFSPLKKEVKQHKGLDVLNGIAYNPETQTIFVTGKRWDKLFEVRIIEK
ncbi:glutaminyl-peptide cyclotransferase [Lacinutrix sp. 5H-3-7-4]|uniref:glutaminyl-peptide cyclotransferase n=1 Tax=Lacinutrix sp. (strain 5H-3-7-4) TaxID=983544 RepID=UPI00020A3BD5|nr:glutaminyl-peptide cyclotransferase [Lacinutrix sp. 5H-3-7-4]AEH02765.1 glutamine cyclotransferase [Lacinutrix sp. 5H-3-7-4]